MSEDKVLNLNSWEEVIGDFKEMKITDKQVKVSLYLGNSHLLLKYPHNSKEARLLQKGLKDVEKGRKIGILRTALSHAPIKIRIVDDRKRG